MQRFDAPAPVHELAGQPVEQFGVAGRPRTGCRGPRSCATSPVPKYACQTRLTNDAGRRRRDCGSTSQFASVSRVGGASLGRRGGTTGTPGVTGSDRLEEVAALEDARRPRVVAGLEDELRRPLRDAPSRAPRSSRSPPSTRGRSSASSRRRRRPARGCVVAGDRQDLADPGGHRIGRRRPRRPSRRGGSGRGCWSGCRRCSSRRGSA